MKSLIYSFLMALIFWGCSDVSCPEEVDISNISIDLRVERLDREMFNLKSNELVESFRAVDTSLTLGAGFERNFGVANVWFAGFSYSRGLVNIVSDSNSNFDDFSIKNDMYQIDLGIKF